MNWLTGWKYRKSITLSRASGAVTNYQMKILVGESSGASGEDVDCGGKCLSSFNDLRFTKADGVTLLDYWIESISGTTPNQLATVWVEFDSIGTAATTFFMYYGNDGASAGSNGDDTFLFFDDFSGASLDTDKWTVFSGEVSVADGALVLTGTTGTRAVIESKAGLTQGAAVEVRAKSEANDAFHANHFCTLRQTGDWNNRGADLYGYSTDSNKYCFTTKSAGSSTDFSGNLTDCSTFAKYKVTWLSGSAKAYQNDSLLHENTTNVSAGTQYVTFQEASEAGYNAYIDHVFARKFVATEPAWGSWGSEEEIGGNDEYTKLLLHFRKGKTWTAYGNSQIDTAESKFGGASLLLDGDGDYVSAPDSGDWNFGNGNFTIEAWVKLISTGSNQAIVSQVQGDEYKWMLYCRNGTLAFVAYKQTGPAVAAFCYGSSGTPLLDGEWHHVAAVRNGTGSGCLKLYIDGSAITLTTEVDLASNAIGDFSAPVEIGRQNVSGSYYYVNGHVDEVRLSKGIARWTSNFIPPAQAYRPDNYAVALLHFDGEDASTTITDDGVTDGSTIFIDSSASGHTMTVNGGAQLDTAQYKFASSGMFDGVGDDIRTPVSSDFHLNGDFTIDAWGRFGSLANFRNIIAITDCSGNYEIKLFSYSNVLRANIYHTSAYQVQIVGTTTLYTNSWYHVAFVRSGNAHYLFLNGALEGSETKAHTMPSVNWCAIIGYGGAGGDTYRLNGWVSEARVSKGIARWTAAFSPPAFEYTAPSSSTTEVEGAVLSVVPGLSASPTMTVAMEPGSLSVAAGLSVSSAAVATFIEGIALSVTPGVSVSSVMGMSEVVGAVLSAVPGFLVSGAVGMTSVEGTILSVVPGLGVAGVMPVYIVNPGALSVIPALGVPGVQVSIVPPPLSIVAALSGVPEILIAPAVLRITPGLSVGEVQRFKDEHYRITYLCVVTGDADGMTDLVVPISSFQGRFRSGDPSFLSVVAPGLDYAEAINARANGDLIVYMVKTYANGYVHTAQLMAVDLENIDLDEGSTSQSITLSGHRTEAQSPKAYTLRGPSYHSIRIGRTRYRCVPDLYVRPGDTVTVNGETFVAGLITWTVGAGIESMEVSEA